MAYAGISKGGGGGGAENLRIIKNKKKVFTQIKPAFLPRCFAQIPKRGAMTQFCALLLGYNALLALCIIIHTVMAQCPPKYAPASGVHTIFQWGFLKVTSKNW